MNFPHPIEPPEPYRRLTLLDLMGLVAASGLGLVGWEYLRPKVLPPSSTLSRWPSGPWDAAMLVLILAMAVAWLVVLRGLGRLREARREVGFLTAAAVVVAPGFGAFALAKMLLWGQDSGLNRALTAYLMACASIGSPNVAAGVAIAWLALVLLGGWRRAGGTLDRMGVAIGGVFLGLNALDLGLTCWYGI